MRLLAVVEPGARTIVSGASGRRGTGVVSASSQDAFRGGRKPPLCMRDARDMELKGSIPRVERDPARRTMRVTRDANRDAHYGGKEVRTMSGVIDDDGQQWERCNGCGGFVEIETLAYEKPSAEFEYGRDLCVDCVFDLKRGNTVRMQARLSRNKAEKKRVAEALENSIEEMACGHTQRHGSAVWRFKDIPTGNPHIQESRCRMYCSETCADKDPVEGWIL
jgi:hypothetical protein